MAVVARTSAGVESALLVNSSGALVTAAGTATAASTTLLGEMKRFLVAPEDEGWVRLDGSHIDPDKHPRLAEKLGGAGELPNIEYMWAYAG